MNKQINLFNHKQYALAGIAQGKALVRRRAGIVAAAGLGLAVVGLLGQFYYLNLTNDKTTEVKNLNSLYNNIIAKQVDISAIKSRVNLIIGRRKEDVNFLIYYRKLSSLLSESNVPYRLSNFSLKNDLTVSFNLVFDTRENIERFIKYAELSNIKSSFTKLTMAGYEISQTSDTTAKDDGFSLNFTGSFLRL